MSTYEDEEPRKMSDHEDAAVLAAIGRKDQLERNWGFWHILGFAVTNLCSWEFAVPLLGSAFLNGGPVALVYGFASTFFGILAINCSLAEMASMYPVAGGQYFWTYYFAPPKIRVFLSYLQGWFTSCAWQVGFVSTTLFITEQILGIVALNHPDYVEKGWHIFLIMVAFSLFNLFVHTYGKRILPMLQAASGVAHILFFIIIVVVILALSPKAPSSFVWTKFENTGGWSNNGISFCIGLLLPAFSISGADGCVHMAEEVRNASWNIPRVFVYTLLINGTMAFGIVVVCLYAITDLKQVLDTRTGYPIIQILYNATGSYAGTTILDLMMVAIQITCSLCLCAASSRLAWSFSRENGFPGSNFMKKVHPTFKVPLNAIIVSITFAICLSTIVIGSTVAIDAVVSLCTVAAFASYTLPIASFLWYRLTHTGIRYGPWRMGWYGPYVNAFALCWCIFFVVILPFPPILPVTPQNMNWSGPIFLAITILLSCDWVLRARHVYHGPVIEIPGVSVEDTAPAQEIQTTFVEKK